jgi:hypothetical protein
MTEAPKPAHCYYDVDGRIWSVEGFWCHPQHRPYHKGWSGEYVIAQEYGNFKNEIRLVKLEDWPSEYTLAWAPMRVCQFCGFTRMMPCATRQRCPNLGSI